jgi:hypothetical protein
MKNLIKIAKDNEVVQNYLSIKKEMLSLPRSYFINVLLSILGDDFRNWVEGIHQARNMDINKKSKKYKYGSRYCRNFLCFYSHFS